MDYKVLLLADLEKGYSKSDLERLIGLPKNNLSGILKGDRKLSKKSELKIQKWNNSEKPDPLNIPKNKNVIKKEVAIKEENSARNNSFENAARGRDKNGVNNDEVINEPKNTNDNDIRIAKIEELLKLPAKYLPHHKRTALEKELAGLKKAP